MALGTVAGLLLAILSVAAARVYLASSPPKHRAADFDFESMGLPVETHPFRALDGTRLEGWLLRGRPDAPVIVLGHDLGSSRSEMVGLAIELRDRGFTTFAFDFRAHGGSEGRLSTLGLKEKRDVVGAIDYLRDLPGVDAGRIGLYGVGMGAHASVLAAADRRQVRVLVLDGLYPDVAYPLTRRVWSGWEPGMKHLSALPVALFGAFNGTSVGAERADVALGGLRERDVLLLAPEGDAVLLAEMKRMVRTIPDQVDHDGNLVVLPATQSRGLFGEELRQHHRRVVDFFAGRLRKNPPGA